MEWRGRLDCDSPENPTKIPRSIGCPNDTCADEMRKAAASPQRALGPRAPGFDRTPPGSASVHHLVELDYLDGPFFSFSLALTPPEQLGQPRDVGGDPPPLVRRQCLCLPRLVWALPRVHVSQCLPVGVADDVAA
jgi:hypothetical protein